MRRALLAAALAAALLAPAGAGQAWPLAGLQVPPAPARGELAGAALARVAACARLLGYLRWFHPADQAVDCPWETYAAAALAEAERGPDTAAWLPRLRARVARVAPTAQLWAREAPAPAPLAFARPSEALPLVAAWQHRGHGGARGTTFGSARTESALVAGRLPAGLFAPGAAHVADLGAGLACRVPLALWSGADGTWPRVDLPAVPLAPPPAARAMRLAAVATLWAGLQHFHPRLDRRDWAGRLAPALAEAADAADRLAFERALRRLAAAAGDGQVRLEGPRTLPRGLPPVACTWAEGRLLVEAVAPGAAGVKPGDELISVDGQEAWGLLEAELALTPGATDARRRLLATKTMLFGPLGSPLTLRLARADGSTYAVTLRRGLLGAALPRPPRPPAVERVAGGAWYVDLTRITGPRWSRLRPQLLAAPGVVFDLRGPANDRPLPAVLAALADRRLRTPRFFVPAPDRPDQAEPPRGHVAYTVPAAARPLPGRIAFLSDARSLGDGEVVLALARDAGLGEVVGEPSAGTAGATAGLALPGGWQAGYTGVAAHWPDGRPLGAVAPTLCVPVTRAGLAAGRDEALARAIALVAGPDRRPRPARRLRLAGDISQP